MISKNPCRIWFRIYCFFEPSQRDRSDVAISKIKVAQRWDFAITFAENRSVVPISDIALQIGSKSWVGLGGGGWGSGWEVGVGVGGIHTEYPQKGHGRSIECL